MAQPRADVFLTRQRALLDQRATDERSKAMADLTGAWHKVESPPCAEKYPEQLTFSTGTFRGTRGPEQGFIWWDAGSFRLESATRLVLTTATDELVSYEIRLDHDELVVTDPDGCRFSYRRTPT